MKDIESKKIVGAVLLDFSADFDIINLLRKRMCYGFSTSAILWIQSNLSKELRGFHLMEVFNVKHIK